MTSILKFQHLSVRNGVTVHTVGWYTSNIVGRIYRWAWKQFRSSGRLQRCGKAEIYVLLLTVNFLIVNHYNFRCMQPLWYTVYIYSILFLCICLFQVCPSTEKDSICSTTHLANKVNSRQKTLAPIMRTLKTTKHQRIGGTINKWAKSTRLFFRPLRSFVIFIPLSFVLLLFLCWLINYLITCLIHHVGATCSFFDCSQGKQQKRQQQVLLMLLLSDDRRRRRKKDTQQRQRQQQQASF